METVVAFIADWAMRRITDRVTDRALDAAMARLWAVIGAELGSHPAIARFREAALGAGHVTPDVAAAAAEALRRAEEQDRAFGRELQDAIQAAVAVRARGGRPPSNTEVRGGNSIGDVIAGGPVNIKQRVVNYAERHPARFAVMAVVVALVLSSATYGGVRLLGGVASPDRVSGQPQASNGASPAQPRVGSTFSVQGGAPTALAFSPSGDRLAVGVYTSGAAGAKSVTILSPRSGEVVGTITATGSGTWLSFSPDGTTLAVSGAVWSATGDQNTPVLPLLDDSAGGGSVPSSFVPRTAEVAALVGGNNGCTMRFWDSRSGTPRSTLDLGQDACAGMAFDPSGSLFATYSFAAMKIWDRATNRNTVNVQVGSNAAVFSPTGQFLATTHDHDVTLWDPRTGQVAFTLRGHTDVVTALAFRPDGNVLVSGSEDGTARVWDLTTRKETAQLPGHDTDDDGVTALTFDPTGQVLATADGDGQIRLWQDIG